MKLIFHIDLDAFFAACEQRENPDYIGKPLVVGADPTKGSGRGVVATCSYEARKYGIHSGMSAMRAYNLCPDAIFVKPHFKLYKEASENIMNIFEDYSNGMQQMSIDEAYLDVSNLVKNSSEAKKLAVQIKKDVLEKEGLTCSVGIATNKLIAKIASDFNKSDGITIVKQGKEKEFLNPLPIRKLIGIGPKLEQHLLKMQIKTIGDIARLEKNILISRFGKYGIYLHEASHGLGSNKLVGYRDPKSISHEMTFSQDKNDSDELLASLEVLGKAVHERLMKKSFLCRTVGIRVRYENFETHTKEASVYATNDYDKILRIQKNLLRFFLNNRKIRLIGAKVSNLKKQDKEQLLIKEFC